MTRLAEVKAERDRYKHRADVTEIGASLALTTKPDHVERFRDDDGSGRYVIAAYGLMRADGGYVTVRFSVAGQRDSVYLYLFDEWREMIRGTREFAVAAERIAVARYRLLQR